MGKNVMKLLKPSPTLGKNDFDLSYRSLFSAKFGELLPAYVQETVPNDKIYIKPSNLVRALPLVTSPFLRAKQHVDFWYVPYSAIWSRFNEFMMDKSEPASSALKDRGFVPYIALSELVSMPEFKSGDDDFSTDVDIVGQNFANGAYKLLDLLGYPTATALYNDAGALYDGYKVNLFRLCAYNFIWYKEYRQKYYDDGTYLLYNNASPALLWNLDDISCASEQLADFAQAGRSNWIYQLRGMCQMRYRLWKKDLFTGLMPSTQFGNVSTVDVNVSASVAAIQSANDVGRWNTAGGALVSGSSVLTGSTNLSQQTSSGIDDIRHTHRLITSDLISATNSSFDILSLRKSEAIQRWREASLRAGNQIEDNWEAHYGVRNRSHMITHPTFIGSYDAPLNIGDIDSTAETGSTGNQRLAAVAGKGITSMDGRTFEFVTSDFGVIIGMWSLLPEAEYNSTGIDRMNCLLEREDFFFDEYENLGLSPVGGEVFMAGDSSGALPQPVLGYAPRYWEYKQRFDQVHNTFMGFQNDLGDFAIWASPKYDIADALYQGAQALPLSTLYVNPSIFDVNFGAYASRQDQFLVDFFFNVDAIRSMSVSGMPSY